MISCVPSPHKANQLSTEQDFPFTVNCLESFPQKQISSFTSGIMQIPLMCPFLAHITFHYPNSHPPSIALPLHPFCFHWNFLYKDTVLLAAVNHGSGWKLQSGLCQKQSPALVCGCVKLNGLEEHRGVPLESSANTIGIWERQADRQTAWKPQQRQDGTRTEGGMRRTGRLQYVPYKESGFCMESQQLSV